MPHGAFARRWRPPSVSLAGATLLLAFACSSSSAPDFFAAPPIEHGGTGGGAGKGGGSGGSGDMAGVGNESGAPDATGGTGAEPGGGGETSAGGTGGTGGATTGGVGGGAGTGGTEATGGTGGDQSTGGTGSGGLPGSGGDGAGGSTGGTGGGTGGSGGMGGLEPVAGTGGSSAGSGGSEPGTGGGAGLGGMAGTGGKGGGCVPTEPASEICDGVDNDCDDGVDDGGVCPDDCVGAVFGKHRYLLCHGDFSHTRSEARTECVEHGEDLGVTMDLVRVESEAENGFLVELIEEYPDSHAVWMSATDSSMAGAPGEGSWIWGPQDYALLFYEDGKVVGDLFAGWADDQPDDGGGPGMENCAAFEPAFDYQWDDRACTEETDMFLCEQLDD